MPILKLLITVSGEMSQITTLGKSGCISSPINVLDLGWRSSRFYSRRRPDHGVWSPCWHVWRGWARTYIILRSDMDWWSGWTEAATNSCKISCAIWNFVGRHFTESTRTTNTLEAFHHSFTSLIACQHPSIWVLLKSLQRQQALTDNMLSHIAQGETKLPGTRERERESKQC